MDMQAFIDSMSASMRDTRSDYHLTLGALIDTLSNLSPENTVSFYDGTFPGDEISYRGYYCDLAFEPTSESKTVGQLLQQCQKALGATYEGYKGGDYVMNEKTPLWKDSYGQCENIGIIAIVPNGDNWTLVTKELD